MFLGLTDVAGYYSALERGFKQIGVDAHFFDLSADPFGFGRAGAAGRIARAAATSRQGVFSTGGTRGTAVLRLLWRAWKAVRRRALFPWALLRFDVVILNGADGFGWPGDLRILKAMRKRLIMVFNGSDHRPPYLNGKWIRQLDARGARWLAAETRRLADRVDRAETFADVVVALSASAQFHAKPFVHFLAAGLPMPDVDANWLRDPSPGDETVVRILHCPTDPVAKGTAQIREHIERLRSAGHSIDFREVVGRPHEEVLEELQRCDLLVDELWSDTPMAGLACEAATFGKPTVGSGYYAAEVERDLVGLQIPPSMFVEPGELPTAIERLVSDPIARRALGVAAQAYVRERWSPSEVASNYLVLANGSTPSGWIYEPSRNSYISGWGAPAELIDGAIRAVVSVAGTAGLRLGHNPTLEAAALRAVLDPGPLEASAMLES